MSLTVQTDIWCDKCGNWETVAYIEEYKHTPLKKVRELASSKGWVQQKRKGIILDLCKACSRKIEVKEK